MAKTTLEDVISAPRLVRIALKAVTMVVLSSGALVASLIALQKGSVVLAKGFNSELMPIMSKIGQPRLNDVAYSLIVFVLLTVASVLAGQQVFSTLRSIRSDRKNIAWLACVLSVIGVVVGWQINTKMISAVDALLESSPEDNVAFSIGTQFLFFSVGFSIGWLIWYLPKSEVVSEELITVPLLSCTICISWLAKFSDGTLIPTGIIGAVFASYFHMIYRIDRSESLVEQASQPL